MQIQNAEALRLWLEACLGRISNAEPAALAKYVIALLKKDKDEKELYSFLLDQLDIFLHQSTKFFVDLLFDTLSSKSYADFTNKESEMKDIVEQASVSSKSEYKHTHSSPTSLEKTVPNSRVLRKAKEGGAASASAREKGETNASTLFAGEKRECGPPKYVCENENPSKGKVENMSVKKISKRCKDYDEKGYCMKGDLCLFDHGSDPLVVEDCSVLNFNGNVCDSIVPVADRTQEVLPSAPPLPPSSPPPLPPLPPLLSTPAGYIPEAYNPESPGMNPTPPARDFQSSYFPHNYSGIHIPLHSTMQSNQQNSKPIRARELIGVPLQTQKTCIQRDGGGFLKNQATSLSNKRKGPVGDGLPNPKRNAYDESRCTLILRKVPQHLNKIETIHQHFSKFGKVSKIEVNYDGDPEGALVRFQNNFEATAAHRSTEAIMNNRFIKVYFYKNSDILSSSETVKSKQAACGDNTNESKHVFFAGSHAKEKKISQDTVPERSVNFSRRSSPVTHRTVFNPASLSLVLKKNDPPSLKNQKEEKKDALNKRLELHRKMEKFLESHIEHQKLMLAKLKTCKSNKEKDFLKKTIKELAITISKLQSDYKKSNKELVNILNESKSTKSDTQRELLDCEIDLYKQQNLGSNDTAYHTLLARVNELKKRAKALGLLDTSSACVEKKKYPRSKPGGLLKIDNRTRRLLVSGIEDEKALRKHFLQFGDVEKVEENKLGFFTVCFTTRKAAEMALLNGKQIGNSLLTLSWFENHGISEETDNGSADEVKDDNHFVDEDEDEEDKESRSWRR